MIPLKITILNKPKKVRRETIVKNIIGTIVVNNDKYYVECELRDVEGFVNGIRLVNIHPKSTETKGKRVVYLKDPRRRGRYIKLIRFKDDASNFPVPNAMPFRPGYLVKGVIINENDKLYFRIGSCCHPAQVKDDGTFDTEDNIDIIDE